jgi:DNA processing protein
MSVLVVEAPPKSGALITVEHALKQGREIFAVPGSILSSRSAGTNKLIQDGARPVMDVRDIIEALNLFMIPQQIEMQAILPDQVLARAAQTRKANYLAFLKKCQLQPRSDLATIG